MDSQLLHAASRQSSRQMKPTLVPPSDFGGECDKVMNERYEGNVRSQASKNAKAQKKASNEQPKNGSDAVDRSKSSGLKPKKVENSSFFLNSTQELRKQISSCAKKAALMQLEKESKEKSLREKYERKKTIDRDQFDQDFVFK